MIELFLSLFTLKPLELTYIILHFLPPCVFWLSLSIKLPKGNREEVKARGGAFLMFNLVMEKRASKDHDWFVQRFRLDFNVRKFYIHYIRIFFFCFLFLLL